MKKQIVKNRSVSSLKTLKEYKANKRTLDSQSRFKSLLSTYSGSFPKNFAQEESRQLKSSSETSNIFQPDYERRCKNLCENVCFQLMVFKKLFSQSQRKKGILNKLYGWDEKEFGELMFVGVQLRKDLTADLILKTLQLANRSFKCRNIYNKLKLFLSQLMVFNTRQQEMEAKFMKIRFGSSLKKLDHEFEDILLKKQRGGLKKYVQQMVDTHQLMLKTKIKVHNKQQPISEIINYTGRVAIKQHYFKEQQSLHDVEKYFRQQKMRPQ